MVLTLDVLYHHADCRCENVFFLLLS